MKSSNDFEELIIELKQVSSSEISLDQLCHFIEHTVSAIESTSLVNYKELMGIVNSVSKITTGFIDKHGPISLMPPDEEREITFFRMRLFILLSDLHTSFSIKLLELGLPGLAYDYIALAEDPTYNKASGMMFHDRKKIDLNSEIYLFMILATAVENDITRQNYLKRETTHLRLRIILGDINFESLNDYNYNLKLLRFGTKATKYDIDYLCNLLLLLSIKNRRDFSAQNRNQWLTR